MKGSELRGDRGREGGEGGSRAGIWGDAHAPAKGLQSDVGEVSTHKESTSLTAPFPPLTWRLPVPAPLLSPLPPLTWLQWTR